MHTSGQEALAGDTASDLHTLHWRVRRAKTVLCRHQTFSSHPKNRGSTTHNPTHLKPRHDKLWLLI
jgi:hypothetical protein